MEDIDHASLEDVSAFFRRFYVPSNASLAIVGDMEEEHAFDLAARYFGDIMGGTKAMRPFVPELGLVADKELVLRDRVELDRVYWMWPTVPHFELEDSSLLLLGDILARGKSSRLYRKLVLDEQVAQDVSAYQSGRELAGAFGVVVTARPGKSLERAREVVDAEIEAIASGDLEPGELERVKSMRVAGFVYALENIGGFGGQADRLNAYNVYRGDPSLILSDLDRFEGVTAEGVKEVAGRYLRGKPRVALTVVGRSTAGVGARAKIDRGDPPASGRARAYRPPLPTVIALDNGMPLWVFPVHDLPTVAGSIVIPGGAGLQSVAETGLAELTLDMLDEGTKRRTAAQIAELVESVGASVSAGCGWDGAYISFKCLTRNLDEILAVMTEMLIEPSFPESEWARWKGQTLAALRAERDSAESRAHRALLGAIYSDAHPYRHPIVGTIPAVERYETVDLKRFHARYLVPSGAGVVVAGDVEPKAIAERLNRLLSGWKGNPVEIPEIGREPLGKKPRLILLDRPGAPQAVLRVGHLGIERKTSEFDRLLLFNQILGGQFTSRLNSKLREERGFTYGIRSQFDCRRGAGPFLVSTSVQSDKVADALNDIHGEILAMIGERPPVERELENARRALVEGHPRHFETPRALVNRYGSLMIQGMPVDDETRFADRLEAIDLDSMITAGRANIHPESFIAVVVADAADVRASLETVDWAELEVVEE
jgi:predicted Zn-dependent peptidase